MFVGMRESRGRGGPHRPGRRAVGFGFAGKTQLNQLNICTMK